MPSPCVDITATRTVRLRTAPEWLPEKYRLRPTRIRAPFRPCAGERRVLRRRRKVAPSVWAPKNRIVTYGPLKGSRWDNSFMPHMRGVIDAGFFPSVRVIGNCKTPQTGSSAGVETAIGYCADVRPGDTLIVYPDRETAAKRSTDYLQPMFKNSPRLRTLLTGSADDMASMRINLKTMRIYMGWSGSVTALGNVSAIYLVADEVDKWQEQPTKKETSTLKLFFERFRAFKYGAKAWLISTPTLESGNIWVYLTTDAQVVFDYHVPCPDCGNLQPMSADKITVIGDETDPRAIMEQDLGRYACSACGSLWDDRKRTKALQAGLWHARDDGRELWAYLRAVHPEKICFHSPGWVSPLVRNSEIAAARLRAEAGGDAAHYYATQICAVAYKPSRRTRKEDAIYALADDRPDRLVPGMGQVAALVAAADVQADGFYYQITAIGWGLSPQRWQIRYGKCVSLDDLATIMFTDPYQDAEGLYYPVHLLVIDSGYRTTEVYNFTRQYPGRTQAYKGGVGRKANPHSWTTIDRYPGTKVQIPGGVKLVTVDTHHYKDQLASVLQVKPDDPGAWHLLASVNDRDAHGRDYAAQMCAEYVNQLNLWECPEGRANHYWDTGVMTLVAEDILQIKYWQKG
jgi:phage terminase large subunit GpA-like protein